MYIELSRFIINIYIYIIIPTHKWYSACSLLHKSVCCSLSCFSPGTIRNFNERGRYFLGHDGDSMVRQV